jgi:hypothetical protein
VSAAELERIRQELLLIAGELKGADDDRWLWLERLAERLQRLAASPATVLHSGGQMAWYQTPYPKAKSAAYAGKMPRPLYPPDAAPGHTPSVDGPDVVAIKRALKRGQRWAVDDSFESFDDSYSNRFAHGDGSGNVGGSGVAGFQRQQNISPDSGWIGQKTFDSLNWALVPTGPNKGQPLFDDYAVTLLEQAWDRFQGKEPEPPPPPPSKSPEERVREQITKFCTQGIGEPDWYYSQARAIDKAVNPNGPSTSDCSGSVIQIFWFAKQNTGLDVPDPAKQGWSGYGNTQYYECEHPKVGAPYKVGDLAHYYDGHVTCCYRAGDAQSADWWSFGSEPPSSRKLHYRDDFWKVVRPPLLK